MQSSSLKQVWSEPRSLEAVRRIHYTPDSRKTTDPGKLPGSVVMLFFSPHSA
jgi:hypothetical protein